MHVFKNICCGYLILELPRRGDSNEYPHHMFLWRTDENYPSVIIRYPPYLVFCKLKKYHVTLTYVDHLV